MLFIPYTTGFDIRASVDGGTEGSNIFASSYSNALISRNYATNQAIPVVSGLTLGVHTVKMRINGSSNAYSFYGFEILNQNATAVNIGVNPGIAYSSGQKLALSAQSLFSYAAPVTGTTGGRAVIYLSSSATIGQAWQACAASPSYMNSASHTNEEVFRDYNFREFGANRSDDFSTIVSSLTTAAFTLDDGTTSLLGTNVSYEVQLYRHGHADFCRNWT
jgi:hypothetical protein